MTTREELVKVVAAALSGHVSTISVIYSREETAAAAIDGLLSAGSLTVSALVEEGVLEVVMGTGTPMKRPYEPGDLLMERRNHA